MSSRSRSSGVSIYSVACAITAVGVASYVVYRTRHQREDRDKLQQHKSKAQSPSDVILVRLFQEAAATSTKLGTTTNGDKLMLYGLYKQATVGNAPTDNIPSVINLVASAKHSAWSKFTGMASETAMFHYIQAVKELGDGQSSLAGDSMDADSIMSFEGPALGLGLKPSVLIYEDDDEAEDDSLDAQLRKAAATSDNMLVMKELIEQGANVNGADDHGETALHFCADRGMLEGVVFLVELGANANAADDDGISVLQAAVIAGHTEVCRILLEEGGADPDHVDSDGDSPRSCALEDHSEKMQALFEKYATAGKKVAFETL
jgi:acyl-CoA-binding protein